MSRIRALSRLLRLALLTARHARRARAAARRAGAASPAAREAWVREFQTYARACLELLGIRLEVHGTPPAGGYLLVSNHVSYLDIVVLAAACRPVFIAKGEIARWPLVGPLARRVGTVFVHRGRIRELPRMNDALDRLSAGGQGLVIFPEGTTTDGRRILEFRPALLEFAARAGRAVHVAALSYRTPSGCPPAEQAVAWWADMTLVDHLWRLLQLPEIEAHLSFGDQAIADADRKRLARRLQGEVEHLWQRLPGAAGCLRERACNA